MATLVRAFSYVSGVDSETEAFKIIIDFCGAVLLASVLSLTYGLDLSPGFF
jgi:hypothetical protein